jgi:uncharacterized protein DUF6338
MDDTLIGLIVATVVVLPGFVTQELTVRGRTAARSDGQSAIQRALFYAVLIHLAWSPDTWHIVEDLSGHNWRDHYAEVAIWVAGALVVSPVVVGLAINEILLRAERDGGHLTRFHYALGGRDARDAWDYMFQSLDRRGAWILVRLVASTPELPIMFVAKYGRRSIHAQSPGTHDVFFEEVWSTDASGVPIMRLGNLAGMWIAASQIETLFPMRASEGHDADPAPAQSAGSVGMLVVAAALLWALRPRLERRH